MAKFSQLLQKLHKYLPFFASELVLLLFLIFAVGNHFILKANAKAAVPPPNRSLFFVYLAEHPKLNPRLVDASASVSQKLAATPNLQKQILSASVKEKTDAVAAADMPLPTLSGQALLKPNPAGENTVPKKDIEVYQVRPGDTVARIAASYGVSEYTITEENDLGNSALIKPGQELRILPTTGIKHVVKAGESLESIAKKYKVDPEDILAYNEIELPEFIMAGDELIIPGGVEAQPITPKRQEYLAGLQKDDYKKVKVPSDFAGSDGEYIWPLPAAHRISQGFRRSHPGIDLPCRECEVIAAGDGIVEIAGWQRGYGNTILINHGQGRKTRYGHASNLLVSAGDRVTAGQVVMISGSTGRSTGAHLHFEIIENGVHLNPLSKVK